MEKIRTVALKGLWVLMLAQLLMAPTLAQNTPQSTATPAAASAKASATPRAAELPAATPTPDKERPKTVGELLLGEGGGPSAKSSEPFPSSKDRTLRLPDPKQGAEHWAAQGNVGQSTFFDQLVRVCWSLAIISLLVWVVAKVAEKAGLKEVAVGQASKSLIDIIEKKRLAPGRTIMIMRVGPKVLVVAATEKGYETLTEMDGEQFKSYQDSLSTSTAAEAPSAPSEGGMTPSDVLRHYLSIIPGTGAKK